MPIKFRCQHCKQLLGIAHTKAGKLVDCPTCGRTLRVPNLDGTVGPPPELGLNLADDGLRKALEELGQIGRSENETLSSKPLPQIPTQAASGIESLAKDSPLPQNAKLDEILKPDGSAQQRSPHSPSPLPSWTTDADAQREIAKRPFAGAEHIDPSQGMINTRDKSPSSKDPEDAAVIEPVTSEPAVAAAAAIALEPLPDANVIELPVKSLSLLESHGGVHVYANPAGNSHPDLVLAELANGAAASPRKFDVKPTVDSKRDAEKGARFPVRTGLVIGGMCFLSGGLLGFGIAKFSGGSPISAVQSASTDSPTPEVTVTPARLEGVLVYADPQGRLQADAGARILLIPVISANRKEKLPSVGFRLADGQVNRELAEKALADVGGTEATADKEGRYQLNVPGTGDFRLIALSRFQGRNSETPWPKRTETILRDLFDRPEQLVGKTGFHVETIQHPGTGPVVWNHVFDWE